MDNLYYTPEIEDFCIGFEYEVFEKEEYNPNFMYLVAPNTEGSWYKDTYPSKVFGYSLPRIMERELRVKYLDNIDIEELGWKNNIIEIEDDKYKQYIRIKLEGKYTKIEVSTHKKGVRYFASPPYSIIFVGIIKNKNELKKLMKQLNIL